MPLSFDFASLRRAYARGGTTPVDVAREVLARIAAYGDDAVWISRVPPETLLREARALQRRRPEDLPLYGVPFAVKDNIDVKGLPTTAACPGAAYLPCASAPVVDRLIAAGALLIGKTNLDQFATGLTGTRSPYGTPRNPFDPAFIPGGSSSGSAVAVAAGLVAFALGTDTAGSGRVPAAFNNIVGLKPSRGLIPTAGVVPACPSLDCVSIFAPTASDAAAVLRSCAPGWGGSAATRPHFAFAVPRPQQRQFFGNAAAAELFAAAICHMRQIGGRAVEIDFAPFAEAAALLYSGAWLAERRHSIDAATGGRRELLHPVTRQIIDAADAIGEAEILASRQRLAALARAIAPLWREADLLLVPTTGTIWRLDEVAADPLGANAALGYYTNFANLLDFAAIAVPSGFQPNGLPAGVAMLAPSGQDAQLIALAAAFAAVAKLPHGAPMR
jgi:allophanate hydrolase